MTTFAFLFGEVEGKVSPRVAVKVEQLARLYGVTFRQEGSRSWFETTSASPAANQARGEELATALAREGLWPVPVTAGAEDVPTRKR